MAAFSTPLYSTACCCLFSYPKPSSGIHYLAGTGDEQQVQNYLKRFGDINTFLPEPVQDDTCRIGEQVWLSTIPQEAVSLMRGPLGPVLRELSDKAASPLLLSCKGQHFCLAVPLPERSWNLLYSALY